jgi:periplasmic protein TonB
MRAIPIISLAGVLLSVSTVKAQNGSPMAKSPASVLSTSTDVARKSAMDDKLIKKYYNANRKEVKTQSEAVYFREYYKIADKLWQVCEYRMNNMLSMELYVTNTSYELKNGPYRIYYEDGKVDAEGIFKNDVMNGDWYYYHRNGLLAAEETYEDGLRTDGKFWNEDGSELKDIGLADLEKPSFPGGDVEMDKFVQRTIVLPESVKSKRITGKMAVSVWVEPDGSLSNPKIELSLHPELDEAAFKVVDQMPKWLPAKRHNRLTRAKYIIPIKITERAR